MTGTKNTTTRGASAPLGGWSWNGIDLPYRPSPDVGHCELCWRKADELARVTIEPADWYVINGKKVRKVARVAYVCRRHRGEDAQGPPIAPPNMTMAPGTSKRRPQAERLFDDLSLKKGGRS